MGIPKRTGIPTPGSDFSTVSRIWMGTEMSIRTGRENPTEKLRETPKKPETLKVTLTATETEIPRSTLKQMGTVTSVYYSEKRTD